MLLELNCPRNDYTLLHCLIVFSNDSPLEMWMFFTFVCLYKEYMYYVRYELHRSTLKLHNIMVCSIGVATAIRSLHFFSIVLFIHFFLLSFEYCVAAFIFSTFRHGIVSMCLYLLFSKRAVYLYLLMLHTHARLDPKTRSLVCSLSSNFKWYHRTMCAYKTKRFH